MPLYQEESSSFSLIHHSTQAAAAAAHSTVFRKISRATFCIWVKLNPIDYRHVFKIALSLSIVHEIASRFQLLIAGVFLWKISTFLLNCRLFSVCCCVFLWVSWRVWSFDMTSGAAGRRAAKLDGALKRSDTLSQLLKLRRYDDDEKWCVIKSFKPCSLLTSSCCSRAEPTNLDEIEPWRNAVFSLGLRINLFPFPTTTTSFSSLFCFMPH